MARNFNGTSDLAESATGISPPLDGSNGPFTVAFWFRSTSTSQTNKYILNFTENGGAYDQASVIYEFVNDKVEFFASGYGGTDPRTGSQITVADTNWHHIAYRKDASGASAWNYFLDGTKTQISASINFTISSALTRVFVGAQVGAGFPCACDIADLGTWNTSVDDASIAAMAKGYTGMFFSPTFFWDFVGKNSPETARRGGLDLTLTGTAAASHPRIIYPRRKQVVVASAAAPASAKGHYYRNHLMARRRAS